MPPRREKSGELGKQLTKIRQQIVETLSDDVLEELLPKLDAELAEINQIQILNGFIHVSETEENIAIEVEFSLSATKKNLCLDMIGGPVVIDFDSIKRAIENGDKYRQEKWWRRKSLWRLKCTLGPTRLEVKKRTLKFELPGVLKARAHYAPLMGHAYKIELGIKRNVRVNRSGFNQMLESLGESSSI